LYFGPFDFQPDDPYSPPSRNVQTVMGDKATGALKTLLGLHLAQKKI
jgi:hypothetical protein